MTADIAQTASIAGELAPNLYGRTDFAKYDGAWARAHNWIVDYRGGLFTRAGFEFGDIIEWSDGQDIKFVEFQYAPDTANTYVCIFGNDYVRFVQNNAYVVEANVTVASLANSTGDDVAFTATSHGFSDGDWVKLSGFTTNVSLNNRTVEITNSTTNTFEALDPITGTIIEIASVSTEAGVVNRIYTIASPYGEEELARLRATQVRDYVRLTHPDYPVKNLIRNDATDWALSDEDLDPRITAPTNLAVANSSDDNQLCVYQVTAIDDDGNESTAAYFVDADGPPIVTSNNAENELTWTAVDGARRYNIYRSRLTQRSPATAVQTDFEVGYIGFSIGNKFTDTGITPDFTKTPALAYNPFANGAIRYVNVDAGGTGALWSQTITWPAGGSGAKGFLITEGAASEIFGVIITEGGEGYTGTSVTVSGATGETLTAELSPASGNNPHCACIFQQRMVYAATDNFPLRIFGSRSGLLSNFAYTDASLDEDSYEFDLDTAKIAPIRHLVPVRGGLLAFSEIGVWLVFGRNDETLTGNNAQADLQNNVGCSLTAPIYLDSYVMYVSQAGQEIFLLAYDDYNKVFGGKNVSLLSNHLFKSSNPINSLSYAPVPSKIVYATQENGALIATTVDIENSVYACTPLATRGYFRYCLSVMEDNDSRLYVAAERMINGARVLYFERLEQRENFEVLEECFCVDAGLRAPRTYPAARLIPDSLTGSVTFTASASVFSAGDVGKVLRCGSGKATITTYTSGTQVSGTWTRDLEELFPETEATPAEFLSGKWSLDSTFTTLNGLWHLEGENVVALADGEYIQDKTVTNGAITLSTAASSVVVGIPYTCKAQTLPVAVGDLPIEHRRKDFPEVALRMHLSIGLKVGASLDKLYAVADRKQRLWSEADKLKSEFRVESLRTDWNRSNQIWFVQDSPRPAAILSVIRDTDVGDDKDSERG